MASDFRHKHKVTRTKTAILILSESGGTFTGIGEFIRSGEFIRRTK